MKYLKILLFSVLIMLFSCEEKQVIPHVNVNFRVNIYSTNLVHVGGHEYFTGGVGGIFIYRSDMNTFHAYDRACPYDWQDGGRIELDSTNNIILVDYRCGAKFNILDGYPLGDGKVKSPLQDYQTQLLDDITLQVYN